MEEKKDQNQQGQVDTSIQEPVAEEPDSVHQGLLDSKGRRRSPWLWVSTTNFAEGIPYTMVMFVSVIMYKNLGISNKRIAFWTSMLYLPWVVKPLWAPLVDLYWTKRKWIIWMQLFEAVLFGIIAMAINLPTFFVITMLIFYFLAFVSSTHDIACDGFYMLGLSQGQQAWFAGIRSTFFRLAMLSGMGLIPILAGQIQSHTGLEPLDLTVTGVVSQAEVPEYDFDFSDQLDPSGEVQVVAVPSQPKIPAGATGEVFFQLSRQPEDDKEIAVNFGLKEGSKNLSLKEGDRFVFTAENWDEPQRAVIGVDARLAKSEEALYRATAGNIPLSWTITFAAICLMFLIFFFWHNFALPFPAVDRPGIEAEGQAEGFIEITKGFFDIFKKFFTKKGIVPILAFLLFYRLGEAQLVKLASPFLLDSRESGGLALDVGRVGFTYGTIGILFLTIGGILSGFLAARDGLKKWIWWMALAINLPDTVYIYMSYALPDNYWIINACVAIEQFGYGFGFTGYMLFMIFAAQGEHKTAHYAIATGLMALGMMIPGMFTGHIQVWLNEIFNTTGYFWFFVWVVLATIPGFITLFFIPLDPEFGKKKKKKQ